MEAGCPTAFRLGIIHIIMMPISRRCMIIWRTAPLFSITTTATIILILILTLILAFPLAEKALDARPVYQLLSLLWSALFTQRRPRVAMPSWSDQCFRFITSHKERVNSTVASYAVLEAAHTQGQVCTRPSSTVNNYLAKKGLGQVQQHILINLLARRDRKLA